MAGKTRPSLRAKTLMNVGSSNLSETDKQCIQSVFEKYEALSKADVVEVKHGEWIEKEEVCSCGERNEEKNKKTLTPEQQEWAYQMWCLGYTQMQIADALFVCEKTIYRCIKGKPRIRPVLIYEKKG